jgi:cytidylate kinase
MKNPVDLSGIRIITISGRIGAGSTSLAKHLAEALGWKHIEGGEVFWEAMRKKMHVATKDTDLRPDQEDILFEEKQKEILKSDHHVVLESKLAGFCAVGLPDVFKVAVICENEKGEDMPEIRIDRLINREKMAYNDAKTEVFEREKNDLAKWRKLYAKRNISWVYWDAKYYDLVVNTFTHGQEESLGLVLEKIGYKK